MYFLAIVSQQDLMRGNIVPSYTLCQSHGASENRSPWRVYKANTSLATCPKVLVRSLHGNEAMIDFLSAYRTRDHMHGSKRYRHHNTMKYRPEGALFWFECNDYGEQTGPAVFIKRIPDPTIHGSDGGLQRLKEALTKTYTVNELFSRTFLMMPMIHSGIKPKLYQVPKGNTNK